MQIKQLQHVIIYATKKLSYVIIIYVAKTAPICNYLSNQINSSTELFISLKMQNRMTLEHKLTSTLFLVIFFPYKGVQLLSGVEL